MKRTAPGSAPGPVAEAAAGSAPARPPAPAGPPGPAGPLGPAVAAAAYPGGGRGWPGRVPGGSAALLAGAASWYAALPSRRRDVVQDVAFALVLAVLNLLSLLPYQSQMHPAWLALLLVGGQCLPLALRRVAPVPALIGCGILRNLYDALHCGAAPRPLAPAIASATVADRSAPLLRWCTVAATTAGVAWSQALPGHNQPYDAI